MTVGKYFSIIVFQCKCILFFYLYLFLTVPQKKCLEGNGRSGTAVFRENLVAICTHDRRLSRSVDMDIFMDIHGYIHGYPQKICGYGYGWQISYPRQAWAKRPCPQLPKSLCFDLHM